MAIFKSKTKANDDYEFVNRWEELNELESHMEEVIEGNGRFVLLEGEAGVGKSRLAERFSEKCSDNGFEFLYGRCLYHESTDPYIPFIDALGDYIKGGKEEDSSEEQGTYMGMGARAVTSSSNNRPISLIGFDSSSGSEDISLTDKREVMFTKVLNLIKRLSNKSPILLFLDDLQWIDESSSQLLHLLVRNISDNRVMILGAYRPEELKTHGSDMPLEVVLDRMKQEKLVDILKIDRLGFQPVSEMIKNHLQSSDLPESFLLMLYRETEGNPYYIVEILNSMVDEGVIDPYSYNWNPDKELSNISIPPSIKDITTRRIERLDEYEKKVLMYASVIGTEFNFEVLENAMDMDVIKLLDTVDELDKHGLITEKKDTDEELYRFNHLQIRMTIYENMGKSRKRVLNRQIGKAIEEFYSKNLEEHYYSLSRHFFEGKQYGKAYEYSMKAGERAIQSFAIETGIEYFDRAVESLRKSRNIDDKKEKELDLLKRIGKLSYDISEWDEATTAYESLLELSREMEDRQTEADSLRWLGHINKENQRFEKAKDYYEKSLEIYKDLDSSKGIADCNRGLGHLKWREGKFDMAIEHYQIAIEEGKESTENNILALTYIEMGNIHAHRGENDLAIEYFKRSIPQLKNQNAYRNLARAYNNMGDQYMKKEEWEQALEYFDKSIEYSKKIGNKIYIGWAYFNKAESLAKKGDSKRARSYAKRAEKMMQNINDMVGLSSVYRVEAIINRIEGNWEEALNSIEKSWEQIEDIDIPFQKAENKYELGKIYEEKDEPDIAKNYFKEAKRTFEDIGASQYINKIEKNLKNMED